MGTYTLNSWCYYSVSTIIATGEVIWTKQAQTGGNPGYSPATYAETSSPDNNFSPNEVIDPDYSASDATYLGTVTHGGKTFVVIQDQFGQLLGSVDMNVPYADWPDEVDHKPGGDINAVVLPICFLAGTAIATESGEKVVEALGPGDIILAADGRRVEVKWIGRQNILTRFNPVDRLRPVRFAAGSLGRGLPHSDLTVTADHAILVEGVLCNASALVNGATITRVPLSEMGDSYTVYHIETEAHEIILASGAETETYIDHASRRVFDNYAEYEALYGEEVEMQELPLPRATTQRALPAHIRRKISAEKVA